MGGRLVRSRRDFALVIGGPRKSGEGREVFAEMIERWYPDVPKIELFRHGPARSA
jgi:hypothetical protein